VKYLIIRKSQQLIINGTILSGWVHAGRVAKIFGVKKNDSVIPSMPQPPTRPLSPIDEYARGQIQERKEVRKQAVQHLA